MELANTLTKGVPPKAYSPDDIRSSRKFFGFVVSNDPGKILHTAGYPEFSKMDNHVAMLLTSEAEQRGIRGDSELLEFGIRDVYGALGESLQALSAEDATSFVSHPKTLHAFAAIALRDGADIETYITGLQHRVQHDASFYNPGDIRTNPLVGCPFAGSEGEVSIDPLFARFVPWAAQLVIQTFEHQRKNAT